MKFQSAVLAGLVATSACNPVMKRHPQLGELLGSAMSAIMPTQKVLKTETSFAPTMAREGLIRKRLWYGPYKIKGLNQTGRVGNFFSMDPGGSAYTYLLADLPKDITILQSNITIRYADDREIDVNTGLYNHHLLVMDMSKTAPTIATCANGWGVQPPGMSMIGGSSEDRGGAFFSSKDGKFDSGYYVGAKDRVFMTMDVVNYGAETKEVYAVVDIQYVEGKPKGFLEGVTQLWSVGTCDGQVGFVRPPPGQKKFALSSKSMKIVKDGYFLAWRGHLHDGGVNLVAKVNDQVVCDSHAKYGGVSTNAGDKGTINEMGYCFGPTKVVKGDNVTLEAHYDLVEHPPRMQHGGGMAEEMALMSVFFAS